MVDDTGNNQRIQEVILKPFLAMSSARKIFIKLKIVGLRDILDVKIIIT